MNIVHHQTKDWMLMKIYLDNCCYGRPYDDQTQAEIRAETNAIENIIRLAQWHCHVIFSSAALDNEINAIKVNTPDKHTDILEFYKRVSTDRAILKKPILEHYAPLAQQAGIRKKDAIHLCFAISAGANYLVTTDKGFVKGAAKLRLPLFVINPLKFPLGGII